MKTTCCHQIYYCYSKLFTVYRVIALLSLSFFKPLSVSDEQFWCINPLHSFITTRAFLCLLYWRLWPKNFPRVNESFVGKARKKNLHPSIDRSISMKRVVCLFVAVVVVVVVVSLSFSKYANELLSRRA